MTLLRWRAGDERQMPRRRPRRGGWSILARTVGAGALLIFLVVLVFPGIVAVLESLKPQSQIEQIPAHWLPSGFGWNNYTAIFGALDLPTAFFSSALVAVADALLVTALAFPAGYAVARYRFWGRRAFLFTVLAALTFSPVVIVVSLYSLLNSVHLINSYWALILPDAAFSLPFSIWLAMAYISTIPAEIDEAARVDGATTWQVITRVVAPVAAPGLATIGVYSFVQSWNEFLFANTFIVSNGKKTLPVVLNSFVGFRGIQWQYLSASVVVATVPAIVLFIAVQRWIVGGLAFGAVRG